MALREVTPSELSTPPHSAVGLVFSYWPDGSKTQGSAAVVGRNDVITATHVIYDPARGGLATGFDLFFGVDFNSVTDTFDSAVNSYALKAGTYRWDALRFPDRVYSDSNPGISFSESQYDVALIGVSVPVGDATGWFGIDPARDFTQTVTEIGYPEDGTGMMTGPVTVERNGTYGVYVATGGGLGPGSSGGPLFSGDLHVIGVKSASSGGLAAWADVGMVSPSLFSFIGNNDWLMAQPGALVDALGVHRALYGAAPDQPTYRSLANTVGATSSAAYAAGIARDFAASSGEQLASTVLADMGISVQTLGGASPAASYAALRDAVASIFNVYADARGQVVLNMTNLLEGLEADTVYGAAARAFNDRIDADYAALTLVGMA